MGDKILKTINEVQTINAKLREKNARLTVQLREANENVPLLQSRALAAEAEVARLEGLILAAKDSEDPWGLESDALWNECDRIRAQRDGKCPECKGTGATGAGVPCCNHAQREVSPTTILFLNQDGTEVARIENLAPPEREERR